MERHCSSAAAVGEIARILRPIAVALALHMWSIPFRGTSANLDEKRFSGLAKMRTFRSLSSDPVSTEQ
jgi:hypothetical protein